MPKLRCPGVGRTRLLKEGVKELEEWMQRDNRTNSEIAFWLPKYILFRGSRNWRSMGPMSKTMRDIAESQDQIGWREFMEGKISHKIVEAQNLHCAMSPCRMSGRDWAKHFISRILQLSHSQWIFRVNISTNLL